MVLDDLAKKHGVEIKRIKFKSLVGEITLGGFDSGAGKRCLLMKPTTYMNSSGVAVREALQFYKLPPERLIVVCDDINLDVGVIRIRESGSDGGQKGLNSIIVANNADNFPRIRVGVGAKPNPDYPLEKWVLSLFQMGEAPAIEFALCNSLAAVEMCVKDGVVPAMNKFNGMKRS